MFENIPVGWLVDQNVPLVFFIIALITSPSTWTQIVISAIRSRLS